MECANEGTFRKILESFTFGMSGQAGDSDDDGNSGCACDDCDIDGSSGSLAMAIMVTKMMAITTATMGQ